MDTREYIFVPRIALAQRAASIQHSMFSSRLPVSGPVRIHLVEAGHVRDFQFSPQQFDYGSCGFRSHCRPGLHFAGFRVVYHSRNLSRQDEVASFLGPATSGWWVFISVYGSSARVWRLIRRNPRARNFPALRILDRKAEPTGRALERILRSWTVPAPAGAYRFAIKPGESHRQTSKPACSCARMLKSSVWRP